MIKWWKVGCKNGLESKIEEQNILASLTAAIVLLLQQLGLNIFPKNISDIVNTILLIATIIDDDSDNLTATLTIKSDKSKDKTANIIMIE